MYIHLDYRIFSHINYFEVELNQLLMVKNIMRRTELSYIIIKLY